MRKVKMSAPKTENQTLSMLPQPTRGSGAQCKLPNPKGGRGAESQPKRVLVHFELEVTHAVTSFILEHFREIQKRLPVGNYWGHCPQ